MLYKLTTLQSFLLANCKNLSHPWFNDDTLGKSIAEEMNADYTQSKFPQGNKLFHY